MKKLLLVSSIILVSCVVIFSGWGKAAPGQGQAGQFKPNSLSANMGYGKMPLYFIPNEGQMDKAVAFCVQGKDKTLYFTSGGLTFLLAGRGSLKASSDLKTGPKSLEMEDGKPFKQWALKLDFVEANPDVRPRGEKKTGAVISYFKGRPADWKTGLATYSRIIYPDLWPGIDLACSGTFDKLKYEFIVRPGADPSKIRLAYRGASDLAVNKEGQLEVKTPVGGFHDDTPVAYQETDGKRLPIEVNYSLNEKTSAQAESYAYSFNVGEYDRTQSLTLDPAIIVYCGYIGGTDYDWGLGIAVDSQGYAYVTGITASTESTFPENVGPYTSYNGPVGDFPGDAFVAKVNATGTALVYCGYIGGTGKDAGHAIAVDSSGNAYVTGATESTEASFPVHIGPSTTYGGSPGFPGDVFVAKVNAAGTALSYCGYIGGTDYDTAWAIAVDSTGHAYVAGRTNSTETSFPVAGGPFLTHSGATDAFVAKVEANGSVLVYCGYIGGEADETGFAIAIDSSGNAYVAGATDSSAATFPVTAGPDLNQNGGNDAFVAKVNAAGTALSYCGYIGGLSDDFGRGIAVDGSGNAYVTGDTSSNEATFPVAVGPDTSQNGGKDAFVAKVNPSGASLAYCGYIGGSGDDYGYAIAVDTWQNAYLTGSTASTEATFPVALGPDLTLNGGKDAFIAEVRSAGTGLFYCGYIGGTNDDSGNGIAVGSPGSVYIAGNTTSSEASFPVLVGPDLFFNTSDDAFAAKITFSLNPPTLDSPADLATGQPLNVTLNWTDTNSNPQEQGYRVRIREQGGSYTDHTVAQDATSYVTSGLTLNTTYEWNVQAMGNGQDVRDSAWANDGTDWSFTTTAVLPSTTITTSPTGLQITVDSTTYTAPHVFQWTPDSSHTIAVTSPQSGTAGTRYAYSHWSDAGNQSHTISAPYSSTTYTATFDTQYSLTTSASPVAGGTVTPSGTTWHNSGAVVNPVEATAAANYVFANWSGDLTGTTNPTSIAMNAPKNVVAHFTAYPSITVTTSPVGRQITVDTVTYTAPHVFQWAPGSSHSIGVTSPQAGAAGTQYVYSSWSDGGAQSHSVSPSTDTTYTANFTTQFSLTTSANPTAGGTVSPAGTTWHNSGAVVNPVEATAAANYVFANWSGDLTGSTNPTSIALNAPKNVVANFTAYPTITVTTSPVGRQITVDTVTYTAPQVFRWAPGSSHSIGVTSPQPGAAGTQYVYSSWSDLGAQTHSVSPSADTTYTASFATQYSLTTLVSPPAGGTVTPAGTTWQNAGSVPIQATAAANYTFSSWSGDLTGSVNPTTINMNGPKTVTANFVINVSVTSSPTGRQITVDSVTYTAPHAFQWAPGSNHTIGVTSPQSGTTGTQYVYSSWSDAGSQSHSITPNPGDVFTANFTTQYTLTTSASPVEGGAVTPSGTTWQNAGSVQVQANPSMYYSFSNWSGDYSGTDNPASVNMDGPKNVVANFSLFPVYVLTVEATPDTGVPITVSPNDIDGSGGANANFTRRYYSGMSVTLTAPPTYIGASFVKWTVDGVDDTNQSIQVTMNNHKTAVAVYLNPIHEIGSFVTPGPARNVFVSGSHAYVAAGSSGLRIIDISNPSSPTEVGHVLTAGSAEDVHVSGLLAFVAAADQGLRIIDVSDPASPVEVGSYDVPQAAYGVYVSGQYAYVADQTLGLKIVNVSNPVAPIEAGGLSMSDSAMDVFVSGSNAYMAASGAGLRVINVSNPASPFEAGSFDTRGTATRVHVSGSQAFVADVNGLSVIDISNPSSPSETGYWNAPDSARGVFAVGAYAYLADDNAGLRVIDISNLPTLSEIGHGTTPGPAYGVQIAGAYAYIADGDSGLRVIDLAGNVSPSITVNSPGGMTTWIKKQSAKVEWTSTGTISNVNIYLIKGVTQVQNIALNTPDDGTATWTVPGTLADAADYSLRIEKAGDVSVNGSSDMFQIRAAAILFPPELQSPSNGATDQYTILTLQWKDNNQNPQEKKYRIRVKAAGGAYVNFDTLANATSYLLTKRTPSKTYYWNIMAIGNGTSIKNSAWANSGVDWSFTTGPQVTLTAPDLSGPANGSSGIISSVNLQWTDPNSNPPELGTKIRIKPSGGAYVMINVARNLTTYLRTGLLPSKTYYWNVQAVGDGTGVLTSAWANGGVDFSFTTAAPLILNAPVLQSPGDGATGQPLSVTLSWLDTNSSPQEQAYQVRIKPAGGSYTTFNTVRDAVSYLKKGLIKNKTYYWNVRAKGTGSVTKDSAWANAGVDWSFTTGS